MKAKTLMGVLMGVAALCGQQWEPATPGYRFQFPRDHFDHPSYQTEWWYYTGNIRDSNGHRFGFELTFFRQAAQSSEALLSTPTWRPDQFYLAHFALSDIDGNVFYHRERLNRAGPGLAGASLPESRFWNGNWQVRWRQPLTGRQELQAVTDQVVLKLALNPEKNPVIQGREGVSRKGPLPGEASHYISFTRLSASGTLRWRDVSYEVNGSAWMDHEFFSEPSDNTLVGWDWFAIQLDTGQELMLYRLRRRSQEKDQFSSGSFVDEQGKTHFLDNSQFSLTPEEQWRSPESGQRYPVGWRISVPSLQLELTERTSLKDQELFSKDRLSPTYWEGAATYQGTMQSRPVKGVGYLEMTGYTEALHLGDSAGSANAGK